MSGKRTVVHGPETDADVGPLPLLNLVALVGLVRIQVNLGPHPGTSTRSWLGNPVVVDLDSVGGDWAIHTDAESRRVRNGFRNDVRVEGRKLSRCRNSNNREEGHGGKGG